MDAGLDTGEMLLIDRLPIHPEDTASTLHDRMAALGASLIVQALTQLVQGALQGRPQPAEGACYASKIDKAEAAIDWRLPAVAIERRLRAFDPFPGCSADILGQPVKVWRGRVVPGQGTPGQVLQATDGRLVLACGDAALELLELQLPGGRRLAAHDFLLRQAAA
jgi:methionyl-tRNA formyltransferase